MLKIEKVDEYLHVTGYPDGSDWVFQPDNPRHELEYGVAGSEHVWYWERSGRLGILHAPTRRSSATIQLGESSGIVSAVGIAASRDGQRLYVLQRISGEESRLKVIDVSAGETIAVHGGLPETLRNQPRECSDGRLLLEDWGPCLVVLDTASGERQESCLPGDRTAPGFLSGSPDGRYWVRFDHGALPTRDTTPNFVERAFRGKTAERLYGVTFQIWEAFPLRFVRPVVVAWLTAKELPNEVRVPNRRAIWDAIALATGAVRGGALGAPPPRSAYPAAVVSDEKMWQAIEKNLAELGRRWARVVGWQPDGDACWVDTNGFLSCVGIDGTVSPRLYTERRGLQEGTWLPSAAPFKQVVPLAGRQARVIYADGEALFNGTPSKSPYETLAIPMSRDQWRPRGSDDAAARDQAAPRRRVAALDDERKRIVVPLAGWTEADCVSAIEALTAQVNESTYDRAVNNKLRIVFALDGEQIEESRFFSEVRARFPGAAPAIRRLIDRYVEVTKPNAFLFSDEDDTGIFSRAVQALGVLDQSAIPTLERYGLLVDAEHEYFFAGETVPAVIAAHGWTDEVVDFVFWVLIRNYYNTLQDYGKVWREWGLRDAVLRREPRALARHLASALSEIIRRDDDPGRYGPRGLEKLAAEIPQPPEPWAAAFFGELEHIFAEQRVSRRNEYLSAAMHTSRTQRKPR